MSGDVPRLPGGQDGMTPVLAPGAPCDDAWGGFLGPILTFLETAPWDWLVRAVALSLVCISVLGKNPMF